MKIQSLLTDLVATVTLEEWETMGTRGDQRKYKVLSRIDDHTEAKDEVAAVAPAKYPDLIAKAAAKYKAKQWEEALALYSQAYGIKETPTVASKIGELQSKTEDLG